MAKDKKGKRNKKGKKGKKVQQSVDEVKLVMIYDAAAEKIEGMSCFYIRDSQPGAKREFLKKKQVEKLWHEKLPEVGEMLVKKRNKDRLLVYIPIGIRDYQRQPFLESLQANTKPA